MKTRILWLFLTICLAFSVGASQVYAGDAGGTINVGIDTGLGGLVKVVPTPVPTPGNYTNAQNVTLTANGSSAIYYTIDGSTPTINSIKYIVPIAISITTTINCIAYYFDGTYGPSGSYTYTLSTGGGGGGGGGGGSTPTPTPEPTVTPEPTATPAPSATPVPTSPPSPTDSAINLTVNMQGDITAGPVDNQNGALQNNLNSVSKTGTLSLTVVDGTVAKKADGSRLEIITVDPAIDVTPLPNETGLVGQEMDFGPDGATFAPPLIMSIHYADSDIPPGSTVDDLYIGLWEGTKWTALETHIDKTAKILTASISHFTDYGLLINLHPVSAVSTPTVTPTPITSAPATGKATSPWAWIIGAIIVVLLSLSVILWILQVVKKKKRLVFIETAESLKTGLPVKMTIQLRDGRGRPHDVDEDTKLELNSSSEKGRFDLNVIGMFDGTISSVVIAEDSNSVIFYYRESGTDTVKIEAKESPDKGWKRGTHRFEIERDLKEQV